MFDLCIVIFSGAIIALLPLITNHPTTDDYYYVPNAVYFMEHPTEPMDFKIHFFFHSPDKPIISPSQSTSLAFEYFRAVAAHYLDIDFLAVYYRSGAMTGLLLPLVSFLLISRFVNDAECTLRGALVAISLLLLSIEGPRTFAIAALWDAYLGKLIFLSIGVPIFAAYSISFFMSPSIKEWICLSACTMAMVGMTPTATTLLPILAVILLGTFILTIRLEVGHLPNWKTLLIQGGLYLTTLSYAFLYALFLVVKIKLGSTTGNPLDLQGSNNGFLDNLFYVFTPVLPLTLALVVLSMLAVGVFVRGWQRKFLFAWMIVLFLTFLNPIATSTITNTIVPPIIYWRLFYLIPFPMMAGVAAATSTNAISRKIHFVILPIAIVVYLLVTNQQGYVSLSLKQLPVVNLGIAQEIANSVPDGLMLAPHGLSGPITMVSSDHPQLITLQVAMNYWLSSPGQEGDVELRSIVDRVLVGSSQDVQALSRLLDTYPQIHCIVLSQSVKNKSVTRILEQHGYIHSRLTSEYVLFWK